MQLTPSTLPTSWVPCALPWRAIALLLRDDVSQASMLHSAGVTRQDGGKGGGANRRAEGSMPAMQSMAAGTARRPASAAKRSAACWAEEPPSGKKPCRRPAECAEKALGGLRPASAVPNGTHSLAGGEPAAGRPQDAAARPAGNVSGGQTHAKAKPTGTGNPALKVIVAGASRLCTRMGSSLVYEMGTWTRHRLCSAVEHAMHRSALPIISIVLSQSPETTF